MPEFLELAREFSAMGRQLLAAGSSEDALRSITDTTVRTVEGASGASITQISDTALTTLAATGDVSLRADLIQYDLRQGPCLDAILHDGAIQIDDLVNDARWPQFAERAVAETGVGSMLSFRMFFEDEGPATGLNLYAIEPHAFDEIALITGLMLATHGAIVVAHVASKRRNENLERALITNRDIGAAIGILMARHRVTKDEAFDLLKMASQHTHRKLYIVAQDVIEKGLLEYPGKRHT
jgi:hypothetical protein